MILNVVAKASLDDVVIDFIGVRLKSGEEVSLNWDESGVSRMHNGFEGGYVGVCFDEEYAAGRIGEFEGFVVTDYQLYSEKFDKEYTRKDVESGAAGFEFEIVRMRFEDGAKVLDVVNPPVAAEGVGEKRYYVNEDYPSETWESILGLTTETARDILSEEEFVKWHKERNERFPSGHYLPLDSWLDNQEDGKMNRREVAQNIGNFFGDYFEENGQVCIDNGEKIFRYNTVAELLSDWVDTLVENHHDTCDNPRSELHTTNDSWEKEIVFIYEQVVGKLPEGIRKVEGRDGNVSWGCSVEVYNSNNGREKNLYLGTYDSIVNAIFARRDFLEKHKTAGLDAQIEAAGVQVNDAKKLRDTENGKDIVGYARYFCGEFDGNVISVDEYREMVLADALGGDTVEFVPIFDGKIYDTLAESAAAQVKAYGRQISVDFLER